MIGSNNDMKQFYFYSRYHFDSLSLRGILLKFNLHLFHDRSNDMKLFYYFLLLREENSNDDVFMWVTAPPQ